MLYSVVVESADAFQPPDNLQDAELVQIIGGSPPGEARHAEGELYRRFAPRVRLYGLRHLREEQAAADLTQHVLLITIESLRLGRLREPEKIASFVLGTCRLVVRDWWRSSTRQERLLEQFGRELPTVVEFAVPEVDTHQLAGCLQQLAERERSVLVMTFYAERTTNDVADQLGLSVENVRVIRHRALGRLRDCMTGRKVS
jgi:RNA polymerase sigma-70 factor, ECF subfamily